ncbi:MAG: tripartite tricarboxylate transporter substrate binding protein [Burkholderiaceae bacterium]|nr:tripartite tricarboxylate transporter substrate binding protein [Burkholderiaceae bacterium]
MQKDLSPSGFSSRVPITRRRLLGAAVGLAAASAFAQTDVRIQGPVKMVVIFGPGSSTDTYARMIADRLSVALSVPVIVENRPGATGQIAAEAVATAKPDGSTLLFTTNSTHAANPNMYKSLRYDPVKDFAPVSRLGTITFFLMVAASSPHHSVQSLVTAGKAAPGKLTYGAQNSLAIVSGSRLGKLGGTKFVRVGYKNTPQVITDLVSGEISFAFLDMVAAAPFISAGKIRALAVLADRRFSGAPNVPTMEEAGVPNFNVVAWFGMYAPAGTPAPIVERFNGALKAVLAQPDLREKGLTMGLDVFSSSPKELEDYTKSQIVLWKELVADSGMALM